MTLIHKQTLMEAMVPSVQLFRSLGLYVNENYLDATQCQELCDAMRSATASRAVVADMGKEFVEDNIRKTKRITLSNDIVGSVKEWFLSLVPVLQDHFDVSISTCEEPQFLLYEPGDFFVAHADSGMSETAVDYMKRREVSAVVFLNDPVETPQHASFDGGELTFYGLLDGEEWEKAGLPFVPQTGTLVAFPSKTIHEVQAVTRGQRLTIVCWYYRS